MIFLFVSLLGTGGCASYQKHYKWTDINNGRERFGQVQPQNKRSWVKTEGVPQIAADKKKRLFIMNNVDPQILALAAAEKRSVWKKTNDLLESMATGTITVMEPEPPTPDLAADSNLAKELRALELSGDWDGRQTEASSRELADEVAVSGDNDDFPVIVNEQVEAYLKLFQGELRAYFTTWLTRSGRYLPMMEAEFEAIGLPRDLIYLAMIESGFSQRAYSKAKAVGLWQFMSATGKEYGLEVNEDIDERRGLEKPTRAAARYLANLYDEFGDWYLAVAAYNGGPGMLRQEIKKSRTRDFWQLAQKGDLPLETKRYVPKLIAAIIIAKAPEKFGFTDITYDEPLDYDTITVGPGLSFAAAAVLTNSKSSIIKGLNEELLAHKTPMNLENYILKIPPGTREIAESNLLLYGPGIMDVTTSTTGRYQGLPGSSGAYSMVANSVVPNHPFEAR